MGAEKKKFKATKRTFTFFGGIAFCLFSVVLILNVGYFARFFALPFTYLLGMCSYVIYIFIYIYGLFLFFREKGFKIRPNNYLFGGLLLFIAASMITTLVIIKDLKAADGISKIVIGLKDVAPKEGEVQTTYSFFTYYQKQVFEGIEKGYWNANFINLFQGNKFGGGLLGYAIVGALQTYLKTVGTWVVAVFIALIGLTIIFIPQIKQAIAKAKGNVAKKPVRVKKTVVNEEEEVQVASYQAQAINNKNRRVENFDPVSNADQIDTHIMPQSTIAPVTKTANFDKNDADYSSLGGNYGSNNFAPAFFNKFKINKPAAEANTSEPLVMTGEQALLEENKISTINEQMQLDFNAKPEINEQLVRAKPEFVEPVSVRKEPVMPQVINKPEPVSVVVPVAEPRKPIKWVPPSSEMLEVLEVQGAIDLNNQVAEQRMLAINEFFTEFNVNVQCNTYVVGPAVTRYNIEYGTSVSWRRVEQLVEDLSIRLEGVNARFANVVEGQRYSGIEIPNAKITTVSFKEVFEALPDVKKHPLAVVFGKSIDGKYISADFDEFPHVLVAGTTGSGKSIFTHSIVSTLIMRNSPEDLRLVLIDPKKVEMNKYRDLPHLLCPIINDANIAKLTMSKLCEEMNRRYELLMDAGVSNITQYKELLEDNPNMEKMPFIVVIVDEYADLVDTCKDIKQPVVSIAQKARAAGIHMLIATQRPSTNVIDGVIKGNLPTRVALAVASYTDSMTILGLGGGEKLLGKGDMLVQSPLVSRNGAVRLQGCYIQNKEIARIVGYLKEHYECVYDPKFCNLEQNATQAAGQVIGSPEFLEAQGNSEEDKYQAVKEWVMANKYMSMSRIQREMSVGFNRAGRFFKRLQDEGIVGYNTEGNRGCPVLVHDDFYEGSPDTDIPVSSDQSEI